MDRPTAEVLAGDDFRGRALRQQLAVGDVRELVAAHRFVHVVGADEHGDAAAQRGPAARPRNRGAPWDRRPQWARRAAASCGSCSMQAASAMRCFQPPESSPANWLARLVRPRSAMRLPHRLAAIGEL